MRTKPVFILSVLLSLLPIIVVGIYIFRFGLNIPFWDQWDIVVSFLMKKDQGLLTINDLFSQHNEHRPFFPRLIWITLAGFTRYNVNAELWVNFLIALGTFLFFIRRAINIWDRSGTKWSPLLIPLLSLLVFNLGQYESWLQGVQTIMFLGMASVLIGLFLLSDHSQASNFVIALLLGVIANFSMASGLLYWPIGLGVLVITVPQESRTLKIATWIVCSFLCIGLFLTGWKSTSLDLGYIFSHLTDCFIFILNFLGSPINAWEPFAWKFGSIGLGLFMLVINYVIITRNWKETAPYFGIILFVLLSAFSVTAGRLELGLIQARVSRYQTMSVWFWASLLTLLPMLKINSLYKNMVYITITVALIDLMYIGYFNGQLGVYQRTLPAYKALTSGKIVSDKALLLIYPRLDDVRPRLDFLCKNHLSACAKLP